jgi:hypothetical protein
MRVVEGRLVASQCTVPVGRQQVHSILSLLNSINHLKPSINHLLSLIMQDTTTTRVRTEDIMARVDKIKVILVANKQTSRCKHHRMPIVAGRKHTRHLADHHQANTKRWLVRCTIRNWEAHLCPATSILIGNETPSTH